MPTFVEREFRQFLGCGVWARGFARFRCDACHAERLVPFSCKARAVCPSCGGRRMAERAANLVDHVLPAVPMRQWVLSLLFRLRYLLAWNHELCREVLAVYVRALRGFYRRRARRAGIRDAETGRRSSLRDVVTRGYTVPVKTSVRATKARLSELLDRVASGEEIVITSAGKPKAKLIPVGPAPKPFRVNRRLLAMRPKKRHRPAEMLVRDDRDARD